MVCLRPLGFLSCQIVLATPFRFSPSSVKKLKGLTGQVLLFLYGAVVGGLGGWDPYKKIEWLKADGRGSRAESRGRRIATRPQANLPAIITMFGPVRLLVDFCQNRKPALTRCNPSTRELQGGTKFKVILGYTLEFKASLGYMRANQQYLTLEPC